MKIYYSRNSGDPMLVGSPDELLALHREFKKFIASPGLSARFAASVHGDATPYDEFINGLQLSKTRGGPRLALSSDNWLVLEGSQHEIGLCADRLIFDAKLGHVHLYSAPMSLIIQANEDSMVIPFEE